MTDKKGQPIVYVTAVKSIKAAHRLHSRHLSDTENKELYGKCNNFHGHGHNYKLEVTVRGPVDPITGMVITAVQIRSIIDDHILTVLDHKHINKDVPYFFDKVSSGENISVFIWDILVDKLPPGLLYEIKLFESKDVVFVYRGDRK